MEGNAVFWFVVAWLGCGLVDLAVGPRTPQNIAKLIIVAVCLVLVLIVFVPMRLTR